MAGTQTNLSGLSMIRFFHILSKQRRLFMRFHWEFTQSTLVGRMSKSQKKFLCLDCGGDAGRIGEHYMLIDETWHLTGLRKYGMLCIEHVEKRIGRQLVVSDFNDSYLNNARTGIVSQRLAERMGLMVR